MALQSKHGELEAVGGSLPALMVNSESIQRILDVGAGATRVDLLLAATRELTALLGERGVYISLEGGPRIVVAAFATLSSSKKNSIKKLRRPQLSPPHDRWPSMGTRT